METGEFVDSREIMDMLRNFSWNIDTKYGMINFDDLKFYEIIPVLNEYIKKLFTKNENHSKKDALKELENIIKEDGILKEILQNITANEEITAIKTEISGLSEKPKKLKQPKKDLGAKANELFKGLFEERMSR